MSLRCPQRIRALTWRTPYSRPRYWLFLCSYSISSFHTLPLSSNFPSTQKSILTTTQPGSEAQIGSSGLLSKTQIRIHTKANGWAPGTCTYDAVLECARTSLERLGVDCVIFCLSPFSIFSPSLLILLGIIQIGDGRWRGTGNEVS